MSEGVDSCQSILRANDGLQRPYLPYPSWNEHSPVPLLRGRKWPLLIFHAVVAFSLYPVGSEVLPRKKRERVPDLIGLVTLAAFPPDLRLVYE